GGYEYVLDIAYLIHRGTAQLSHSLRDPVHPMDVRLTELPAVRVDRQSAPDLDVAVLDEVLRLAATAEPELFQLHEDERREVVVDDRGLDVVRRQPGLRPQLPPDEPHLGKSGDVVAVVARHGFLIFGRTLRGRFDQGGT